MPHRTALVVAVADEEWDGADGGLHHVEVVLPLPQVPVRVAHVPCGVGESEEGRGRAGRGGDLGAAGAVCEAHGIRQPIKPEQAAWAGGRKGGVKGRRTGMG